MDELQKKLEEAVASDPENPDLQYNLGLIYLDLVSAAKNSGNAAGSGENLKKAEAAFTKAISKSPDNLNYNYNFGVLYFNQGTTYNDQMNNLVDKINDNKNKNQKEDQKQYDAYKAQREEYMSKAIKYFEVVYNKLDPKASTLTKEEKDVYKSCLQVLQNAYTLVGKNDKYKEIKDKYDGLK
jgi:tetratricopeptide (TPR) repeat protein